MTRSGYKTVLHRWPSNSEHHDAIWIRSCESCHLIQRRRRCDRHCIGTQPLEVWQQVGRFADTSGVFWTRKAGGLREVGNRGKMLDPRHPQGSRSGYPPAIADLERINTDAVPSRN